VRNVKRHPFVLQCSAVDRFAVTHTDDSQDCAQKARRRIPGNVLRALNGNLRWAQPSGSLESLIVDHFEESPELAVSNSNLAIFARPPDYWLDKELLLKI